MSDLKDSAVENKSSFIGKMEKDVLPQKNESSELHVIILGNGFDKYLKRPTSYAEFYNSNYCPKNYPSPLIAYLNGESSDGKNAIIRWYDFETALLDYISSPTFEKEQLSPDEIKKIKELFEYNHFSKEDFYYPTSVQSGYFKNNYETLYNKGLLTDSKPYKFIFDKFFDDINERDEYAFELIKQGLTNYLNDITKNEDNNLLTRLVNMIFKRRPNEYRIVYTFNYTKVPSIAGVKPGDIHYVHGSCAMNNIILGTRENQAFKKAYWFLQKVFDQNYNPVHLSLDLLSASKVSIFGHSLGVNDGQYFQAFFNRQCNAEKAKKEISITIYTKDDNSVMDIKRSLQELTNFHLSDLLQYSNLKILTEGRYLSNR